MHDVDARLTKTKKTKRAGLIDDSSPMAANALSDATTMLLSANLSMPEIPEPPHSYPAPLSSDVFVTRAAPALNDVTLVVYEWHNVEPGTLSWVFPSLNAALEAVRAMKNAVRWLVLRGRRSEPPADVDEERARGFVLCEA